MPGWGRETLSTNRRPPPRPPRRPVIENLILIAIFVSILAFVVITIGRLLVRRKEQREQWERDGRPEPTPRTPEEQERDRKTAITWGCIVVAVPVVLMLLYYVVS